MVLQKAPLGRTYVLGSGHIREPPPVSGGDIEEVTPDPFPNSEVKLLGADGTARET